MRPLYNIDCPAFGSVQHDIADMDLLALSRSLARRLGILHPPRAIRIRRRSQKPVKTLKSPSERLRGGANVYPRQAPDQPVEEIPPARHAHHGADGDPESQNARCEHRGDSVRPAMACAVHCDREGTQLSEQQHATENIEELECFRLPVLAPNGAQDEPRSDRYGEGGHEGGGVPGSTHAGGDVGGARRCVTHC